MKRLGPFGRLARRRRQQRLEEPAPKPQPKLVAHRGRGRGFTKPLHGPAHTRGGTQGRPRRL